jgi:hypothetical protein
MFGSFSIDFGLIFGSFDTGKYGLNFADYHTSRRYGHPNREAGGNEVPLPLGGLSGGEDGAGDSARSAFQFGKYERLHDSTQRAWEKACEAKTKTNISRIARYKMNLRLWRIFARRSRSPKASSTYLVNRRLANDMSQADYQTNRKLTHEVAAECRRRATILDAQIVRRTVERA